MTSPRPPTLDHGATSVPTKTTCGGGAGRGGKEGAGGGAGRRAGAPCRRALPPPQGDGRRARARPPRAGGARASRVWVEPGRGGAGFVEERCGARGKQLARSAAAHLQVLGPAGPLRLLLLRRQADDGPAAAAAVPQLPGDALHLPGAQGASQLLLAPFRLLAALRCALAPPNHHPARAGGAVDVRASPLGPGALQRAVPGVACDVKLLPRRFPGAPRQSGRRTHPPPRVQLLPRSCGWTLDLALRPIGAPFAPPWPRRGRARDRGGQAPGRQAARAQQQAHRRSHHFVCAAAAGTQRAPRRAAEHAHTAIHTTSIAPRPGTARGPFSAALSPRLQPAPPRRRARAAHRTQVGAPAFHFRRAASSVLVRDGPASSLAAAGARSRSGRCCARPHLQQPGLRAPPATQQQQQQPATQQPRHAGGVIARGPSRGRPPGGSCGRHRVQPSARLTAHAHAAPGRRAALLNGGLPGFGLAAAHSRRTPPRPAGCTPPSSPSLHSPPAAPGPATRRPCSGTAGSAASWRRARSTSPARPAAASPPGSTRCRAERTTSTRRRRPHPAASGRRRRRRPRPSPRPRAACPATPRRSSPPPL
jgi:hypothetical protein